MCNFMCRAEKERCLAIYMDTPYRGCRVHSEVREGRGAEQEHESSRKLGGGRGHFENVMFL